MTYKTTIFNIYLPTVYLLVTNLFRYSLVANIIVMTILELFTGEKLMMIDIMLWPHAMRSMMVGGLIPEAKMERSRYPRLTSWFEEMSAVPAIKETQFSLEYFKVVTRSTVDKDPNYDYGLE